MPTRINGPDGQLTINAEVLSQQAFGTFGTVITNPVPSLIPSKDISTLPPNAIQANQGSALKYLDVSLLSSYYGSAPSTCPAKAVMNMFVCAPRKLTPPLSSSNTPRLQGFFPIEILERHPFTSQTFIPLGVPSSIASGTCYLVICAPSLPPSSLDENLPVPTSTVTTIPEHVPGRGLPDLTKIKAFIANGSQAITYSAGTWHAPMVVIGEKPIDFVVVQFANDVAIEDCQEVVWGNDIAANLRVAVPAVKSFRGKPLSKL